MIVGRDDPGKRRVGSLKVGVAPVQGIAGSILTEREDLTAVMRPDSRLVDAPLVDVIAQMNDEGEVFLDDSAIGRVVSRFVILTRDESEPEATDELPFGGCRPGSARGAELSASHEPIPVVPPWQEALDFCMNRVPQFRCSDL